MSVIDVPEALLSVEKSGVFQNVNVSLSHLIRHTLLVIVLPLM